MLRSPGIRERKMRRLSALAGALALGMLALAIVSGTLVAQTGPEDSAESSQVLSKEEALARDAQSYASDYGVDLQEAVRRLELQAPIGELGAKLEQNEQGTYAGLWVQHQPDYRVIARFTQGGEQTIRPYVEGGLLEGLVQVRPATRTLAGLKADQEEATRTVQALGVPADSGVDVINNRVDLKVTDRGPLEAAMQNVPARLPETVRVVEVDELAKPAVASFAGKAIYTPTFNGLWCTSGFTVRQDSNTEGVTTAAHCSGLSSSNTAADRPMYYGAGSDTFLPRHGRRFYGSYDVQWHTTPGYEDRAWMYVGETGGLRDVTGLHGRGLTSVGDYVCDFGQHSGYSCSNVATISASIGYVPNSNNTFIVTYCSKPCEKMIRGGDSGGPHFLVNDAYGITSGSDESANYHYGIYMPINYVDDMGVIVQLVR